MRVPRKDGREIAITSVNSVALCEMIDYFLTQGENMLFAWIDFVGIIVRIHIDWTDEKKVNSHREETTLKLAIEYCRFTNE